MGNRKSKLASAVIEKPAMTSERIKEPVVTESNTVVTENPVEELRSTIMEEPSVTETTVTETNVEHMNNTIETEIRQPITSLPVLLESIQEVDEDQPSRTTIKSDSTRSLKITFMSANHDPYAYLPKKEPETISTHGKKFKKHQKHQKHQNNQNDQTQQNDVSIEQMEVASSSTNMGDMD